KNDNGHYVADCSRINVDGVNQGYSVIYRDPESLTSKVAKHITVDITAHDESRGQALFVVEKAEMRDASGLYVEARRLNEDESESDELIYFHLGNGPFRDCIPEVEIVRTIDKLQEITPK
ncbi:MAG: hypothetical protein IIB81_01860, partial [Nanoarchaeota archaeon]|nr:hypothetical protein [Nanoarchaeota archaeon]